MSSSNDIHIINNKSYKVFKNSEILTEQSTFKKKTDKNFKRMLCRNVIKDGVCDYSTKCKYAHSFSEQIIDSHRKQAWDILLSSNSLENVDLQKNYKLYQTLDEFTNLCSQCVACDCIGGYNCDHGVFDKKYQICKQDLNYGNCKNQNCSLIHLTHRGLKPWFSKQKEQQIMNLQTIKGTLLSEKFFSVNKNSVIQDDETLSNFTNSSDENNDYENDCDKSIFVK